MRILPLLCLLFFPIFSQQPHLLIEPSSGLYIDQKTHIQVKDLHPGQTVKIEAIQNDAKGQRWSSKAFFIADSNGSVDTKIQAPLKGSSYTEIDEMGLFWSMAPEIQFKNNIFKPGQSEQVTTFSVYVDGKLVDEKKCIRLTQNMLVQQIDAKSAGFIGTLHIPPTTKPLPLVIILSSSSGEIPEGKARLLAARGFAAFALGYFGKESLPKKLKDIPLEYFEKAIAWAKTHKEIDPSPVALYGTSRGGELALILGAFFPEQIQAIAAIVPSSYAYAGLTLLPSSAWQYKGKPALPSMPNPRPNLLKGEGLSKQRPAKMRKAFLHQLKANKAHEAAAIPVEKISCPILLISSGDDQMWPSDYFAAQIKSRIRTHSPSHPIFHCHYPKAGHGITLPFLPTSEPTYYHPALGLWFATGGNKEANARANEEAWHEILNFLQEQL